MKKYIVIILSHFIILFFFISCRENVTDPISEEIVDEKPLVVSLKEIQNPSERVLWKTGESKNIEWEVTKNLDKVKIILLKKFVEVAVLNELTDNDGSFIWNIPTDLPASHHYRIELISPYNLAASSKSVEFEIKSSNPLPPEKE